MSRMATHTCVGCGQYDHISPGETRCAACYEDYHLRSVTVGLRCAKCQVNMPLHGNNLCHHCESLMSATFVTKDSGKREEFETGARRDIQAGKPRYDLIPVEPLRRLAELYARGAEKYGDHNWQKGIPYRRVYASLFRHLMQWAEGDASEDHLAAVAWNAFTLMATEAMVKSGKLPATLDDMKEKEASK